MRANVTAAFGGIAVHAQHVLRMFFVSINNLVQKKIETGDFMWYALCQ
nr:MAG TPA: hypothetical protein [Caudoviricetes sp.]